MTFDSNEADATASSPTTVAIVIVIELRVTKRCAARKACFVASHLERAPRNGSRTPQRHLSCCGDRLRVLDVDIGCCTSLRYSRGISTEQLLVLLVPSFLPNNARADLLTSASSDIQQNKRSPQERVRRCLNSATHLAAVSHLAAGAYPLPSVVSASLSLCFCLLWLCFVFALLFSQSCTVTKPSHQASANVVVFT